MKAKTEPRSPRVLPVLVLLLLAGCAGYRSGSLFPGEARAIYVPIFENKTFYRQIEYDLTHSVCSELRSRPGIHVTSTADADIILEGTITGLDQKVLSITKRERASESSATTAVNCRVVDAKTGAVLKEFEVRERVDFAVGTGEDLRTAQRDAFYDLARKIVFELEADW